MSVHGKSVLVTGADGFIGSHLAERLVEEGAKVRALVYQPRGNSGWLEHSEKRAQIEIVAGDITDPAACEAAVSRVDIVFHLAALASVPRSREAPAEFVRTNVSGTLSMLDASQRAGVGRFVQASSAQTYDVASHAPLDERHPLRARSIYAATKIAADGLVDAFHFIHGLPIVTLKLFAVFGPRQPNRNLVPTIISQILRGPIVRLGNLTPRRDYNYVGDAVDAFVLAGTSPGASGAVMNISGNTELSVEELARTIAKLAGRDIEIIGEASRVRPGSQDVDRLVGNSQKAAQILGWKPATGLIDGLRRTISWYHSHQDEAGMMGDAWL
jgi:nucleoside-diphosphate-sugar epimerase